MIATDPAPAPKDKPATEQPPARPLPTEPAARRRALNIRGW
ncbi:hypothetical protein [Streptomyces sp. AcH 505]